MKRALILGIGGQDGSYLADILLEAGYEVHGTVRRSSVDNLTRVAHVIKDITLHRMDLQDKGSIINVMCEVMPDEVYNEADQDSVGWSNDIASFTMDVTACGAVLAMKAAFAFNKDVRFFQPCSAHMFGDAAVHPAPSPQNEETPFRPQSLYAVAKVAAYYAAKYYREVHGMFVSTGILYNHDSPRRSDHYLLHKVCKGAVEIARGKRRFLALGNLDAVVDIGYARDYMVAAHRMLQLDEASDYILASGNAMNVSELVDEAFDCALGRYVSLREQEKLWEQRREDYITRDPEFWKASPSSTLVGDYSKANAAFGFRGSNTSQLISDMVEHFKRCV